MFSEKAKKTADACRFCWMCRHVCPVGLVTGKEINTARAKGLMISLSERGAEFDASIAGSMWECTLCGACSNDCATGYEPPVFIREARTRAAAEGLAPENVRKVIGRMLETGSMYGVLPENKLDAFKAELEGLPKKADTLLYIGEVSAVKVPGMAKAVISLLKKAGIPFTVLKNEPDSGAYLGDLIGFTEEVRIRAVRLSEEINASGAKTVVVIDPVDARIMKHEYGEWNCRAQAEVKTVTSYITELVKNGALKPKKSDPGEVTFHDAGALSRDLDETQPARDILDAMGLAIKEMFLNRRLSKSCGTALFAAYAPSLAAMTAKGCWDDALRTGATTLLTEAPGSLFVLSRAIPAGAKLLDLFTLLDEACRP